MNKDLSELDIERLRFQMFKYENTLELDIEEIYLCNLEMRQISGVLAFQSLRIIDLSNNNLETLQVFLSWFLFIFFVLEEKEWT